MPLILPALLTRSLSFSRCIAIAAGAALVAFPAAGWAQDLNRGSMTPAPAPESGAVAPIVVTDEGVPSAYGAPAAFSRSRFANLTNAYVLPPFGVYTALIYEGDALRYDHPDHLLTEEIELGLPYRFGVAAENEVEAFRGHGQEVSTSVEMRYALANWDQIPLNPTLFAEYRFGFGNILHDEGIPMHLGKEGAKEADEGTHTPQAIEVRLLLAEEFKYHIEWAFNFYLEQEDQGDRGREFGFAQSAMIPVLPADRLKLGIEMLYRNFTDSGTRGDPAEGFIIGPTAAFKPSRNTRFDVSPLFGVTFDAPRVQAFAVFSYTFGPGESEAPAQSEGGKSGAQPAQGQPAGGEEHESEPASMRNR
jgi:hypothetical protein